jgi:hypothetical protein
MGKKRLTRLERIERDNDNRYRKLIKAELESVERLKRFRNSGSDIKSGRIFGLWAGKSDLGRMATPASELRKRSEP